MGTARHDFRPLTNNSPPLLRAPGAALLEIRTNNIVTIAHPALDYPNPIVLEPLQKGTAFGGISYISLAQACLVSLDPFLITGDHSKD